MNNKIIFIGEWAYFEGMKYWHADITRLGDMRRKGIVGGTLVGDELEAFVIKCLRTTDYRVLGLPMSAMEQKVLDDRLQATSCIAA